MKLLQISQYRRRHPAVPQSKAELLLAVLRAELEPGLTVETAAHAEIKYVDEGLPDARTFLRHKRLLEAAGLRYSPESMTLPDAIVLEQKKRFLARFPHLKNAAPVLAASGGVRPYTNGMPRLIGTPNTAPSFRPKMVLRVVK